MDVIKELNKYIKLIFIFMYEIKIYYNDYTFQTTRDRFLL